MFPSLSFFTRLAPQGVMCYSLYVYYRVVKQCKFTLLAG